VGIEISPCRDYGDHTSVTTVEDAEFWTVYLRHQDGDVVVSDAEADFDTQQEAEEHGVRLAIQYGVEGRPLEITTFSPDYTPPHRSATGKE
jgi:hypothetical protein